MSIILAPELCYTMLAAELHMRQNEWIEAIGREYGNEAARWFSQGIVIQEGLQKRLEREWVNYVEGQLK